MEMLYGAIDIHEHVFQAAVFDADSGEVVETRFPATRERLDDWAIEWQRSGTVDRRPDCASRDPGSRTRASIWRSRRVRCSRRRCVVAGSTPRKTLT